MRFPIGGPGKGAEKRKGPAIRQPLALSCRMDGTTAPARTGDPQIHNLVL